MRRVLLGIVFVVMLLVFAIMIPNGLPEGMFNNEFAPWLNFARQTERLGGWLNIANMFLLIYISKRYPDQEKA